METRSRAPGNKNTAQLDEYADSCVLQERTHAHAHAQTLQFIYTKSLYTLNIYYINSALVYGVVNITSQVCEIKPVVRDRTYTHTLVPGWNVHTRLPGTVQFQLDFWGQNKKINT